ncbi:hypothetical protein FISHEDRAFT_39188 [Fistulina hepatica ATCC 64428]|uniref:F-box domain-containing protein n=1 Tax=Fistulina hepatica ATCC 64428 TaxID=1128425 RepID=A0A0D7AK09_9AGAR|nr:hypothetical protein FISHEDRAFT_39188 [Fistulina hepatica ATCC 64428]
MATTTTNSRVILCPRPYSRFSGRLLLLPLLPVHTTTKRLPSEIWQIVFAFALNDVQEIGRGWNLILVSKLFKEIALPILYSQIKISQMSTLEKFHRHLYTCDQHWDSLRRIPYSAPGRWVLGLDLSELEFGGKAQALALDSCLTRLVSLLPFVSRLVLNPSFVPSRRCMNALGGRPESHNLRSLVGITYIPTDRDEEEPLLKMLRSCENLEELEIIGGGLDPAELEFSSGLQQDDAVVAPLCLPRLHTLTLLSHHTSPLMAALLASSLPSLTRLTITPYDDIAFPMSLSSRFISVHGNDLLSLFLYTPKSWPTRLHPSPETLLCTCPKLQHLSLETPLPVLRLETPSEGDPLMHPLRALSIPHPDNSFWPVLESVLPQLPALRVVRARDVRWVRKGMSPHAREAGVQGEMQTWKKRLQRWRIKFVDSDWQDECQ